MGLRRRGHDERPRAVKLLHPAASPQCAAERTGIYACDTPETDKRCTFSARYEHKGKSYCTRHASALALYLMLNGTTKAHADG